MTEQRESRAARVEAMLRAIAADGTEAVWVDRAPVFDKPTLLHALYQALQLPAWFGFNWDALHDVLSERGREEPFVLVFEDFRLLEERDPDSAATFVDIVESVAADPATGLRGLVRIENPES